VLPLSCLSFPAAADGKTKSLVSALSKVAGGADRKVLLVLGEADAMVMRAGRNVEKLAINTADSVQVGRHQGAGG
jgi:ribosomal protein L4